MATRIPGVSRRPRRTRLDPRKKPVQDRSRATVEYILTAAAQVLEEAGYAAGTTNRIAERAGVSIGTLYQYFPNKEALAVMLLERHIEQGKNMLGQVIQRASTRRRNLRQTLRMFVEAMLGLHADQPRLQHLLQEEVPRPQRVEAELLRAEASAARAVADLLRNYTEVQRHNLERAAYMTVQTVEDLTHRFVTHPPPGLSRRAFVNELVAMVEAYLTRQCDSHSPKDSTGS